MFVRGKFVIMYWNKLKNKLEKSMKLEVLLVSIMLGLVTLYGCSEAVEYEKVDDKTLRVTEEVSKEINIDAVISNRTSLNTSCKEQLAEYDAIIAEAKKKGVQ